MLQCSLKERWRTLDGVPKLWSNSSSQSTRDKLNMKKIRRNVHTISGHGIPTEHDRRDDQEVFPGCSTKRSTQRPNDTDQLHLRPNNAFFPVVLDDIRKEKLRGGNREVRFHETLLWQERCIHKQLGFSKSHMHRETNIGLSQIFIDKKQNTESRKRNWSERRHREGAESRMFSYQRQGFAANGRRDEVKNLQPTRGTARSQHSTRGEIFVHGSQRPVRNQAKEEGQNRVRWHMDMCLSASRQHDPTKSFNADDQLTSQSKGGHHVVVEMEAVLVRYQRYIKQFVHRETTTHVTTTTTRADENAHPNQTESNHQPPTPSTHVKWLDISSGQCRRDTTRRPQRHNGP